MGPLIKLSSREYQRFFFRFTAETTDIKHILTVNFLPVSDPRTHDKGGDVIGVSHRTRVW